jgi:hypothetical protein
MYFMWPWMKRDKSSQYTGHGSWANIAVMLKGAEAKNGAMPDKRLCTKVNRLST